MDETQKWRQMFDRARLDERDVEAGKHAGDTSRSAGYDDGFEPKGPAPSPAEIADEAAMALAMAADAPEYRPWILQRGRSNPVMMLHLRRHDPKSGMWIGWQISYPHLVAVEYTGDTLLSLDFGSRQFILEGTGLDELAHRLQTGSVLMVQQYSPSIWPERPGEHCVLAIRKIGP